MPLITTPPIEASEEIAQQIVNTLVSRVNGALDEFIAALVWSLKRTWQPEGCAQGFPRSAPRILRPPKVRPRCCDWPHPPPHGRAVPPTPQ